MSGLNMFGRLSVVYSNSLNSKFSMFKNRIYVTAINSLHEFFLQQHVLSQYNEIIILFTNWWCASYNGRWRKRKINSLPLRKSMLCRPSVYVDSSRLRIRHTAYIRQKWFSSRCSCFVVGSNILITNTLILIGMAALNVIRFCSMWFRKLLYVRRVAMKTKNEFGFAVWTVHCKR